MSFERWLMDQADRGDAVGELALSVVCDTDAPPAVTVRDVRNRMRAVRAMRRYLLALDQAAAEYRAKVPSNVIPFPRSRAMLSR